ncbi:DUF6386 family protein [Paenibacillus massiliensis]|uniref:DUF6386 family protein n=1 Tax=Paenibacillus massiliensis TaxID=225917 RepID=UPI000417E69D|nr:DUF6386 family protein [Paenibacillus massiliensis]
MNHEFTTVTDTSTVAIFDLAAIRHRFDDTSDWWSIPEDELDEMNQGHILFLGVGHDGQYHISIVDQLDDADGLLHLQAPSGQIFVGAGEDTTGGELEPDDSTAVSGAMLTMNPGNYAVTYRMEHNTIHLSFIPSEQGTNTLVTPIRLK